MKSSRFVSHYLSALNDILKNKIYSFKGTSSDQPIMSSHALKISTHQVIVLSKCLNKG